MAYVGIGICWDRLRSRPCAGKYLGPGGWRSVAVGAAIIDGLGGSERHIPLCDWRILSWRRSATTTESNSVSLSNSHRSHGAREQSTRRIRSNIAQVRPRLCRPLTTFLPSIIHLDMVHILMGVSVHCDLSHRHAPYSMFATPVFPVASRDDTLVKISDIANDVEMLVRRRAEAASSPSPDVSMHPQDAAEADPEMKYLVLDTNVLIHNLDVLRCFSEDLERLAAPMKIVVPDVVLSELDGCVWACFLPPRRSSEGRNWRN